VTSDFEQKEAKETKEGRIMNNEEIKYATEAIGRFMEPARDEAIMMATDMIALKWPAFWENHVRKLQNFLMNPDNEMADYKHGLSLNIVMGVDGSAITLHPEISFGFKEKYVGKEVAVSAMFQEKMDFEGKKQIEQKDTKETKKARGK